MATINELTNAANYTGNRELGGFVPSAIDIDTKPLQTLALYTVAYNKAEYEQRQKDAEVKANELATLAAIDFSKIDKKWQDPLYEKFNEIQKYARENPNVLDYKNKTAYLEYKRKFSELAQGVSSAKANQIILEKRKNDVLATGGSAKLKEILEKRIDADKENTDLYGTMPVAEKYTIEFPDLTKDMGQVQVEVLKKDANGVDTFKYKMPDMRKINQQAQLVKFENLDELFNEQSTEYIGADANGKLRLKEEFEIKKALSRNGWAEMSRIGSQVIKNQNFLTDGKVDLKKLLDSGEETTVGLANLITSVNEELAQKRAEIERGVYIDNGGAPITINEYYPVKYEDGLDDAEIARIAMIANATNEEKKVERNYTGAADKLRIEREGNATTRAGQLSVAATADKDRAERKAAREAKGLPPLPPGGAADKGNIIYSVNGYIGGDKNKKIVDGKVQDGKGNFDPTFSKEIKIDAEATGSYIQSWYNKYNFQSGDDKSPKVALDDKGKLTAQFKNGIIVGIKSSNGGFIGVDEFQKISDANSQSKENKYISETQVGVTGGDTGILP